MGITESYVASFNVKVLHFNGALMMFLTALTYLCHAVFIHTCDIMA
ncbi:hypothetical protein BN1184_AW_00870 [Pantoea ananatis]|nr:hypothetical protein BN1184_AW_00870 [Pantoea ananatis]